MEHSKEAAERKMFEKQVAIFERCMKGKTLKVDGEVWIYDGVQTSKPQGFRACFIIPSRVKAGSCAMRTRIGIGKLDYLYEVFKRDGATARYQFVNRPKDNDERFEKLLYEYNGKEDNETGKGN